MTLDFEKMGGLVPAIIQDARTKNVLMLGFMNEEAFAKTESTGLVTFYSRTKKRLWTKGEESGNVLKVVSIADDCDHDTLLIQAIPAGPVCHTGNATCFSKTNEFLPTCRNSSTAAIRKCRKAPTRLPFSKKASTAWHRKWAKRQ
jgi:phosphoribosyl-ATP pyrophosphohydrolase/phosphoribosyl-AMP cyclohydrolase